MHSTSKITKKKVDDKKYDPAVAWVMRFIFNALVFVAMMIVWSKRGGDVAMKLYIYVFAISNLLLVAWYTSKIHTHDIENKNKIIIEPEDMEDAE